ncbi:SubName: Full=Uncharacterized protein {ECO:0000313/EMBL:CCA68944.1} [Serendipita indica DSM 11827]|nr:SubName: Full=Uncharacterized protein {ECO:0000313/EMBL:CCA68944.1} [Serendipita indica DSM 11827]
MDSSETPAQGHEVKQEQSQIDNRQEGDPSKPTDTPSSATSKPEARPGKQFTSANASNVDEKRKKSPQRRRGPPPLPPAIPPPAGYRRPSDRKDSPPPFRRGRSPEPPRRRSPLPPPPLPPNIPRPSAYGRSRYGSPPPRRSPPPMRRRDSRSRSPPPRYNRSPPPGRRRSPLPPPRRRSPPGGYRRSRSPLYRGRPSPYSRGPSPLRRRSPHRPRTRSPSPSIRHRLPSPKRRPLSPPRSGHGSRRVSPTRRPSPSPPHSPRKRTRSLEKADARDDDDRFAKKRRTLDEQMYEASDTRMQGVKQEEPIESAASSAARRPTMDPPTAPRRDRETQDRLKATVDHEKLRVKTEQQDVEMADAGSTVATPLTPAKRGQPTKHVSTPSTSQPAPTQPPPPPPIPIVSVPKMPTWKKESVTADLDAEVERVRQLRYASMAEHNAIDVELRRALFELDLAQLDLRGVEAKAAVAEKQTELAAKGMLEV